MYIFSLSLSIYIYIYIYTYVSECEDRIRIKMFAHETMSLLEASGVSLLSAQVPQTSEGVMILLETLIELKFINSSFSSLSSH